MESGVFEVDFGNEIGKRSYQSLEEFEKWLSTEKQFWDWIQPLKLPDPFGRLSHRGGSPGPENVPSAHYSKVFSELRQPLQNPNITNRIELIQTAVSKWYAKGTTLHSAGTRAQFVMELKNRDPLVALFALAFLNRLDTTYFGYAGQQGAILASQFENGIADRTQPERASLEQFRLEWQATFENFKAKLFQQTTEHQSLNTRAADSLKQQQESGSQLLEQHKGEWDGLKRIFHEQFATAAPVSYWKERARNHYWGTVVWGCLSALALGGVFSLLMYEINKLLGESAATHSAEHNLRPEYWRLAMLILIGSLGVWFVRMLFRLFINQMHLHNDAKVRVTMTQTYLALLQEDKGINKEDRQLVLASLFRPAPTGTGKEPSIPIASLDILSQQKH